LIHTLADGVRQDRLNHAIPAVSRRRSDRITGRVNEAIMALALTQNVPALIIPGGGSAELA
jgi:hypothetical protein